MDLLLEGLEADDLVATLHQPQFVLPHVEHLAEPVSIRGNSCCWGLGGRHGGGLEGGGLLVGGIYLVVPLQSVL